MDKQNLDKSNLRQLIIDYPNQLQIGQKFAKGISVPNKKYSNFMVCGMGGSSVPAEMLFSYLAQEKDSPFILPCYMVRDYELPSTAGPESLIFISSYSGETEETISCFTKALEAKATIVAFSLGGKIEKMAQENNVPFVRFTEKLKNLQARYVTTYCFAAMHQVLTNSSLCDKIEKLPLIDALKFEEKGLSLAKQAVGKTPVVYVSSKFKFVAKLWKNKLNENSDTQAFWNYFPELTHNELEGFSKPKNPFAITILRFPSDPQRISEKMELTKEFYRAWGNECEIIDIPGETYLEQTLNGILIGDWFSYHLALEYGIDPSPSNVVGEFKSRLS